MIDTLLWTLENPAPDALDLFGASVAISGNLAVVGAYFDDPGGVNSAGAAYVFDATTGVLLAPLNNPEPDGGDFFGFSVAISRNLVVVGAFQDDPGGVSTAGTAYVFDAATGTLVATLNNPAPDVNDVFGYSVAISGNLAVVGAYWDDPGGVIDAGTAYVFDATTGALVATLNNPAPDWLDYFGFSVAISGNLAAVGAIYDGTSGIGFEGTAYVFDATTGALVATLNNPAPDVFDQFGGSVAISGTLALVGAYDDDPGGVSDAGTAYLFDATTGLLLATLNNPTPDVDDIFGYSIAITGSLVVVGAPRDDPGGISNTGTAYLFDATTGVLLATLNNPAPNVDDSFGYSVAISGDLAVIGSLGDDPGGVSNAGTAYMFSCADLVPTPTQSPTATPTPTASPSPSPTPNRVRDWALYE